MSVGIRCLLAETAIAALPLAVELDRLNRERRDVEATMHDEALAEIEAGVAASAATDAYTMCLYRPEWHQGVVGIVASRLKDRFHRPTIVFARGAAGELKGSGRSIPAFHLRDALDLVSKREPGSVAKFGGHAFAAGVSLAECDLPRFAAAFERVAREKLGAQDLKRALETDGGLAAGELSFDLARTMRDQVWGQGFPAPLFDDAFAVMDQRVVGDKHLRLALERDGERFAAILFNHASILPSSIRAAYRPEVNEWNGTEALQLVIEHWEPTA